MAKQSNITIESKEGVKDEDLGYKVYWVIVSVKRGKSYRNVLDFEGKCPTKAQIINDFKTNRKDWHQY